MPELTGSFAQVHAPLPNPLRGWRSPSASPNAPAVLWLAPGVRASAARKIALPCLQALPEPTRFPAQRDAPPKQPKFPSAARDRADREKISPCSCLCVGAALRAARDPLCRWRLKCAWRLALHDREPVAETADV